MIEKMIPTYFYKSIYDIDYEGLYKDGIRLILTDLDNTLISYKETIPNRKLFELKNKIEHMGFEFILVSNSRKKRVDNFAKSFDIPYVKFSTKPLKRGIKKAIKKVAHGTYTKDQVLIIGDQIMTDIYGAGRCKIRSVLVDAIDKSTDIGPTRFNRKLERFFLKKIKKKYPIEYDLKLKEYGVNDDNKKM